MVSGRAGASEGVPAGGLARARLGLVGLLCVANIGSRARKCTGPVAKLGCVEKLLQGRCRWC